MILALNIISTVILTLYTGAMVVIVEKKWWKVAIVLITMIIPLVALWIGWFLK